MRLYGFCCTIFLRDCLAVVRCTHEICRVLLRTFWWDFLRRVHAFSDRYKLCVWNFIIFGCRFFSGWCDVRTVERWMLKDGGWFNVLTVYWTLRDFVCASWVVCWLEMKGVVGKSASALGDRRICVEVVWFALHQVDTYAWEIRKT
jgi:hypothetical protein